MSLRTSKESVKRASGYTTRIAGILGLCALTATCGDDKDTAESPATLHGMAETSEMQAVVDDNRVNILRSLETETQPEVIPVTEDQFKNAETRNGEKTNDEAMVLLQYGGHLFNMQRIPGMEECRTVMQKNAEENSPTNVYMRFPETSDKEPRVIFFLHGNGGQNMKKKDTKSVVEFTKEMQEEGKPLILIVPQDSWGNYYPEGRDKNKPGNWRDFNDPNTFANLIGFAEGVVEKHVSDITLASFSGGNIGIMKILRSLEKIKDTDPEAADLYERIKQIAYFDSATGVGGDFVGRWMSSDSENSVWSHYNGNGKYNQGNTELFKRMTTQGADPGRMHLERMKYGYNEHGLYGDYFTKFILRKP